MGDAGRRVHKVTQLTDNSGGTASDTLADIEATYTEATIANAVASLAAKVNAIIDELTDSGLMEK